LNWGKGGVDRNNLKECSQLRLMEKHAWSEVKYPSEIKYNEKI
jgi:hypothetical protein